jgi:hypothetical protein
MSNKIIGIDIGSCVIGDNLIVFTTDSGVDRIYKIREPDSYISDVIMLYEGNLNFSKDNPIQTLGTIENENIQKVYWVDGRNQPRFINIAIDDSRVKIGRAHV